MTTKLTTKILAAVLLLGAGSTALAQSAMPASDARNICPRDPRTPIDHLPFVIDTSGSYYVPACLTGFTGQHGIIVTAEYVSIDLNGRSLRGVPGSLDGIHVPAGSRTRLHLRNGTLTGWGGTGVFLPLATQGGQLLEDLQVVGSGSRGIYTAEGAMVFDCIVEGNAGTGIQVGFGSLIDGCIVDDNGNSGIAFSGGTGIVQGCQASDNGITGIGQSSGSGWVVAGNTCRANGLHGLDLGAGNLVRENHVGRNTGAGIQLRSGRNFVTENVVSVNTGAGIQALANNADEVVVRNVVNGNAPNFVPGVGNDFGIFGSAAGSSVLWNNISQ